MFLYIFRLRASESVQYFQFDQTGNMFVFEPGAGFTGPSVKVNPGFEMSVTSDVNWFESQVYASTSCTVTEVENISSEPVCEKSEESIASTPLKRFKLFYTNALACS